MKRLFLLLISIYQRNLRFGRTCRFFPSCSEYTYQAIEKYGILFGIFKGLKRILKCSPLFKGGFDPVK